MGDCSIARLDLVKVVSPRLHLLPSLIEPLSPVVDRSALVALLVRKLELDDIWRLSQFVR
jgi:hypothetical protein